MPETFNQERQTMRTKALAREREDGWVGVSRDHFSPWTHEGYNWEWPED